MDLNPPLHLSPQTKSQTEKTFPPTTILMSHTRSKSLLLRLTPNEQICVTLMKILLGSTELKIFRFPRIAEVFAESKFILEWMRQENLGTQAVHSIDSAY